MNKMEIESLEAQLLAAGSDARSSADIMLKLLELYSHIKSPEISRYCTMLRQLNLTLADKVYNAWLSYYEGRMHYFEMNYPASNQSLLRAFMLFQGLNFKSNQIDCLNALAWNHSVSSSYQDGIDYARKAIALASDISYNKGLAAAYNTTGLIYWHQGLFAESLTDHMRSLQLKENAADKLGMASSYNNIALVYYDQGDFAGALDYNMKSLRVKEELRDKHGMAGSNGNIGVIYLKQGNYPLALEYYLNAVRINEEIGNTRGLVYVYHNLGTIYWHLKNYPLAKEYNNKCLQISEASGDKNQIALAYNNMSNVCADEGNYEEALRYLQLSLDLFEDIGNKVAISEVYYGIGQVYFHLNDHDHAINFEKQSLEIAKKIESKQGIAQSGYMLGKIYLAERDLQKAELYLRDSLALAEGMGHKQLLRDVLKAYFELKKEAGDWQAALDFHEKYIVAKEELFNTDTHNKIMGMKYEFEMEKKEREMEIHRLRTVELKAERDRSENLLLNILPAEVAEELKASGTSEPRHFEEVTVLFTDFQNFTGFSEKLTAKELVSELHECFKAFDGILDKYKIEKIKTVGDGYLAASGLPVANSNHAVDMALCAREIRDFMLKRREAMGEGTFELRLGIHTGPVIAGIVGVRKFSYDIWGDTVNTAARMEQNSTAGMVNISGATYELIKDKFDCTYRGKIAAKNKGEIDMYFIDAPIINGHPASAMKKEMTAN